MNNMRGNTMKASRPRHSSSKWRLMRVLAIPLVLSAMLLGGTATSASAATWMTLYPQQIGFFPTTFWGETKLCVTSLTNQPTRVRINVPTGAGEYVDGPAQGSKCIYRWWWGMPLLVNNIGAGRVEVMTS